MTSAQMEVKLLGDKDFSGVEYKDWIITTAKKPILTSEEIEQWMSDLKVKNLPEMIFGNNYLKFHHKPSGYSILMNTFDALKMVDNHAVLPKVAYAKDWLESKEETLNSAEIKKDLEPYDWTFTTLYKGTILWDKPEEHKEKISKTDEQINIELLKRKDPIIFFNELILYEDELADNGIAQLSIKVRVMPTCLFSLMRFWLRIDGVLFRLVDTRLFHEFGKDYMLREVQAKDSSFKDVVMNFPPDSTKYTDVNIVGPLLKMREQYVEKITLT